MFNHFDTIRSDQLALVSWGTSWSSPLESSAHRRKPPVVSPEPSMATVTTRYPFLAIIEATSRRGHCNSSSSILSQPLLSQPGDKPLIGLAASASCVTLESRTGCNMLKPAVVADSSPTVHRTLSLSIRSTT